MSDAPVCPDCSGVLDPGARRCPSCRRALAVRRCQACGARALVVAHGCPACDAPLDDKSVEGLADLTCPACDAPLVLGEVQGVRLHECGACGGVFLDRESFARATDDGEVRASLHFRGGGSPYRGSMPPAGAVVAPAAARERFYRRCAACRTVMSRVNFSRRSAVFVDVCPRHGTWFDRDELAAALAFVEKGGLEETRRRNAEEREREAREARASAVPIAMPHLQSRYDYEGAADSIDFLRDLFRLLRRLVG